MGLVETDPVEPPAQGSGDLPGARRRSSSPFFLKDSNVGSYVGLVIGMLLYVGFSVVLAKFGYTRESMKQARGQADGRAAQPHGRHGVGHHADEPAEAGADQAHRAAGPSNRPERQAPLSPR